MMMDFKVKIHVEFYRQLENSNVPQIQLGITSELQVTVVS
jgi:hypothetical protein